MSRQLQKRMQKDLGRLHAEAAEHCVVRDVVRDLASLTVSISVDGPVGTPYEGGTWVLKIKFPADYP